MPSRILFGDVRIPFGSTYRGVKLKDVPLKYLDWCMREFEEGSNWTLKYPDFQKDFIEFWQQPQIQEELARAFDE